MIRHLSVTFRSRAFIPFRLLHTSPKHRYVRTENVVITNPASSFPTIAGGLSYTQNIFGLLFQHTNVMCLQRYIWNNDSFLPTRPAQPLTDTPFKVLSDIAQKMPRVLRDGNPGLLHHNALRSTVYSTLVDIPDRLRIFHDFMTILSTFRSNPTPHHARIIADVAFWSQWLIRGILFEGKLHGDLFTSPYIPSPLSKLAFAANAALGRHQIEFVYDDYTLNAATFPTDRRVTDLDYDDPNSLLAYIADIATPVGFNDVAGRQPEHNFRHNHTLMEAQMTAAFAGWNLMQKSAFQDPQNVVLGWSQIADAAKRAHKVFATMMTATPPHTYPAIRLPIRGVRGACGNVYPDHGVFYEGCGTDAPLPAFAHCDNGCFVDNEFGQTGANSSMYKWFDAFVGVTQRRAAYSLTAMQRRQMVRIISGDEDAGTLGVNPIDSMQRAFDLLTRPTVHLQALIDVHERVTDDGFLSLDKRTSPAGELFELAAVQRLRLAYYVALHRCLHGQYVNKMIYSTQPIGGQSRAHGTGGSTPPFLKTFFDQTYELAIEIADAILRSGESRSTRLTPDMIQWVRNVMQRLHAEEEVMANVQRKGLQLEKEEEHSAILTASKQ